MTEKEWLKAIDDGIDFDDEEEEEKEKKKKGRKRKSKRAEDSDDDSVSGMPVKKRKGQTDPKLKKQMKRIMNVVMKYSDADGRILSEPFMKLPSKRELPDYYEIIKKPLDIKKILQRIDDGKYVDFSDLERDFIQLCQNAQIYNEETSLIYADSIMLQSVFSNAKQRAGEAVEESEGEGK